MIIYILIFTRNVIAFILFIRLRLLFLNYLFYVKIIHYTLFGIRNILSSRLVRRCMALLYSKCTDSRPNSGKGLVLPDCHVQ